MSSSLKKETGLLLKHTSIYGMSTVTSRIVGFLMIPIYTAYITPMEYGIMELVNITINLLQTVIGFGLASGITRFYFDSDDQTERNKVISSAFFGLGGLVFGMVGILALFSSIFATYVLDSATYTKYFVVAFASLAFGTVGDIHTTYFRANKNSVTVVIISLSKLIAGLSLNIYFLVGLEMGVWGIFVSNLITSVAAFAIVSPLVLKRVGLKVSREVMAGLIKFGLPLIPSNIASYLVMVSDRFFIKEYVNIAQTGIYSLGYRFGTLINNFVTSPFNQIWGPRRLELFGKERSEELFSRIFTYYTFVLIFSGLIISILSRDIVVLMTDSKYWEAYAIIPAITLAHTVYSFFYHFNVGIIYEKKTKYFAYINVANAVLNLGLNYILIKKIGVWGAVLSMILCSLFRTGSCYYFSNRLHKILVEWRRLMTMFVVGFGYYFLIDLIQIENLFLSITVKGLLGLTYPGTLYLLRFLNDDEKTELKKWQQKGMKFIFRK